MAKEQTEGKFSLKLIHIFWTILVCVIAGAISYGAMKNQQSVNTESIKAKVEKEVFDNHKVEQRIRDEKTDKKFEQIDKKLDKIIEKI